MLNWIRTKENAVLLSVITFATFIARGALDFRYVFNEPDVFPQDLGTMTGATFFYALLFTGWLWAHIKAERGSRRAWLWIAIFNGLAVLQAVSTTLILCPTPCDTAWPLAEIVNWSNLAFGLPASYAAIVQFRK